MEDSFLCEDCGWKGVRGVCNKKYRFPPMTKESCIEPYLTCPKCDSENLIPLIDEPVLVG